MTATERESGAGWLAALRLYLGLILVGNLVWEFVQMPLYTLWLTDTAAEIAFAGLHCTAGDLLIALAALTAALVFFGRANWPRHGFWQVALAAGAIGLGYTVFSEWLNVEVRQAWAYRPAMPVLPVLGTGLAPLAQWIVVPGLAFWITSRSGAARGAVLPSASSEFSSDFAADRSFVVRVEPPIAPPNPNPNPKAQGSISAFRRIDGEDT